MNKKIEDTIIKEILQLSKTNGGKVDESTILSITRKVLQEEAIINPNEGEESEPAKQEDEVMRYSLTEQEMREELKTLTQLVSSRAKIFDITVTNEDGGNVIMQGELLDFKIKFIYILNESEGVYFKSEKGTRLTDKTISVLNKLVGYYDNWKETWMSNKLTYYI